MLKHIGRYEILRQIGKGGMGIVYEARHTKLQKIVALKILPAEAHGDRERVARFEREMRAAGHVKHPGFVQALDADEADGFLYLAMELVDGCDLAHYCAQDLEGQPFPVSAACEIVRQASTAMHHANASGMIHRDLKPSNLMLNRDGQIKILDLGLATFTSKNTDLVSELTRTGQVVGTLDYMSPEQVSGDSSVDHRTDIYALGATLYYLLCGEVLYPTQAFSTVLEKLQAIAKGKPSQFTANSVSWPPKLRETVAKAIAKAPEQRFRDAAALAEQLEEFADAEALLNLLENRQKTEVFQTVAAAANGGASVKVRSHLNPVPHSLTRRRLIGGLFTLGTFGLMGAWIARNWFNRGTNEQGKEIANSEELPSSDSSPFSNDIEAARWIVSKGGNIVAPQRKSSDVFSLNPENLREADTFQLWGMTWKGQDITPAELTKFRKCRLISMLHMDIHALTSEHITAITKIHAGDALVLRPRKPFLMTDSVLEELLANANMYWALGFHNIYGNRFDLSPLKDKLSLTYLMIACDSNADRSIRPRLDQRCIDSIGEFPNLISLDLRNSILEASDFRKLFSLSKLKKLYLNGTESTQILVEMPTSIPLTRLDLDDCDLSKVYSKLLEMKSLKHLSLLNCQLRKVQLDNLVQALPDCFLVTDFGNIHQPTLKADFAESWFYPEG